MGKGQRTASFPCPSVPVPGAPLAPGAALQRAPGGGLRPSPPGRGTPGTPGFWGVRSQRKAHPAPGTPGRAGGRSRCPPRGCLSLQRAGSGGRAGESVAMGSSQIYPWGLCPTAEPAWGQMPTRGNIHLLPFPKPCVFTGLCLNQTSVRRGCVPRQLRIGDNCREMGLCLHPAGMG